MLFVYDPTGLTFYSVSLQSLRCAVSMCHIVCLLAVVTLLSNGEITYAKLI